LNPKCIVESYDTRVTLRQLFYGLVAAQVLPNTQTYYRRLSAQTAQARRDNNFPDLVDGTREISGSYFDNSPGDALRDAAEYYIRSHTPVRGDRRAVDVNRHGPGGSTHP
jgi:hypothetical protein